VLTPEIVERLRKEYGLQVGRWVSVPDGRTGKLMNVRFDPDIGSIQFIGPDNVYRSERFSLSEVKLV
jgi:hypothetical protein